MENREHIGSRIGFIMLAAGCSIGCGNVWKFPWMCGQYGGGTFMAIYFVCLILLGLPIMTMEFSIGRAAQTSPVKMYKVLGNGKKFWSAMGWICLFGNIALMSFYTVVTGWIIYYFVNFLRGTTATLGFVSMIQNPNVNIIFLFVTIVLAFVVLCFKLQSGVERVTKYMMIALLLLIVVLGIHSLTLSGAKEGIAFYLIPKLSKISGNVIVGAMNQAFFTLSVGMGSMAIFGSYIDKNRTLMGETINIIVLDTVVAVIAGIIIFPACFTYGVEVGAGPSLLFDTMANVFNNMTGGRWWGSLFFLFMVFAALSTVLGVCENIVAMVREITGWNRPVTCVLSGIVLFATSTTTALGYSKLHFQPFAEGSAWLDFWDFLVSTNILPLGSLVIALFCCYKSVGWGWENFVKEANAGTGVKVQNWMKPIFKYFVPLAILFVYIYGMVTFNWK